MEIHQLAVCRRALAALKPRLSEFDACLSLDLGWAIAISEKDIAGRRVSLLGDPVYNRLAYGLTLDPLRPGSWKTWAQVKSMGFAYRKMRERLGLRGTIGSFSPQHAQEYRDQGIPCRHFRSFSPAVSARKNSPEVRGKLVALHVGSLQTSASRSMLNYWDQELFPKLANLPFNIEIRFVGKVASRMESRWKNIQLVFLGHLESIDDEFANAHVFFSPMKYPIGTRTRVVTSMAYGTPVIADESAAGGLPELVGGRDLLYASSPAEVAAAFERAYRDENLLREISKNGRHAWETYYNPEKNVDVIIDEL